MKVAAEPVSDNSGGSSRSRKSIKSRGFSIGSAVLQDDENENLGDDFEKTPWVPPSIAKALEFKRRAIYRYADGVSVSSIDVIHAADLGAGVTLYFAFARTMAFALFFMSIMSVPALIMVYSGSGVLAQDRDALGLFRYTLGNIGTNPASPDYVASTTCTSIRYPVNTTCIHFLGGHELSLTDAGAILTTMEFFQMAVFLTSVWAFSRQILALQEDAARRNTTMSDYAIKVSHIPPNTTAAEVLAHFNSLYQLEVKDFRKRPALENARPVPNHYHNGDESLVGTWISEIVIHKSIGKFISSFKSKQHITTKLYRARAKMKMYSKNSCHEGGLDSTRYLLAQREMQRQANKIDKLTAMNVRRKGLKLSHSSSRDNVSDAERGTPYIHEDIYTSIDAPTVAAFITFEYSESLARCVHDYQKYAHFPMSLFYPRKLKLKGRKIKVTRAPEPDQIIWENLEVTRAQQLYLRTRTNLITIALVVLCFIIILQASIYKQIFSARIPSSALCKQTVPELYTTSSVLTSKSVSSYTLTRPPTGQRTTLDAQCASALPDTFYAIYTKNDNYDLPVVPYNVSACTNGTTGASYICPDISKDTYCPCVSISDGTKCHSAECSLDPSNPGCIQFKASAIGSCYCYAQLSDILNKRGVIQALNTMTSSSPNDPCYDFYRNYSVSSGITFASIIFASMVNIILKFCIKHLVTHEAHTSVDKEQGSRMSKVFMSNYFTMAVIVLIAYGKIDGLPAVLNVGHIFDGDYRDFDQGWYGNVGFYFLTTFILQSFAPLMLGLLKYLVIYPLGRLYHHARVRRFKSHSIVMQRDLNLWQVGDVFDATTHTAQLLTLLFFAMTFAPGLPLLMPLCCFSFVMYFHVDKTLLCRFCQRPSQIGDASIKIVVSFLPYAAVLRFAIAIWMYSCPSIFPLDATPHSSNAFQTSYLEFLSRLREGSLVASQHDEFKLRVLERNTFPLFVALVVIVLTLFLRAVWTYLPLYWVYKFVNCLIGCFRVKQSTTYKKYNKKSGTIHPWHLLQQNDPLRQEMAPFTGEYFKYVRVLEYNPDTCCQALFKGQELTQAEINHGWGLHEQGDFVVRKKCTKSGRVKKTYEVIADSGCHSFNIEMVPAYVLAVKGLKEGTNMADGGYGGGGRKRPGSAGSRKTGIDMDPDYLADLRARRGLGTEDYDSEADNSMDGNMIMPTEYDENEEQEVPANAKYNFDIFDEPPEEDEMLVMMRQKYQQQGIAGVRLEPIDATKNELKKQQEKQQQQRQQQLEKVGTSGKVKRKPQPKR